MIKGEEVDNTIKALKNNKDIGPGQITNELLRQGGSSKMAVLTQSC